MRPKATTFACLAVVLGALAAACSPGLIANLTAEAQGNLNVQFINNTPFVASFTAGTYDDLDRTTPGPIDVEQRTVAGDDSTAVIAFVCGRDFEIGTPGVLARILATDSDDAADFNLALFHEQVYFSSAPVGTDAAALPTEGTAEGLTLRLGVDYTCDDRVLVIFEQDPNAPGGFRIDHRVIEDVEDDA